MRLQSHNGWEERTENKLWHVGYGGGMGGTGLTPMLMITHLLGASEVCSSATKQTNSGWAVSELKPPSRIRSADTNYETVICVFMQHSTKTHLRPSASAHRIVFQNQLAPVLKLSDHGDSNTELKTLFSPPESCPEHRRDRHDAPCERWTVWMRLLPSCSSLCFRSISCARWSRQEVHWDTDWTEGVGVMMFWRQRQALIVLTLICERYCCMKVYDSRYTHV